MGIESLLVPLEKRERTGVTDSDGEEGETYGRMVPHITLTGSNLYERTSVVINHDGGEQSEGYDGSDALVFVHLSPALSGKSGINE